MLTSRIMDTKLLISTAHTSCHPPEGPAYVTAYETDKSHKNEETTTVDVLARSLFLLHSV